MLHYRLGAVVAGAYGYALGIENSANIVGVDLIYNKGEDADLVLCCTYEAQALDLFQRLVARKDAA